MLNVFKYLSGWRSRTWFLLIALAAAISPIMPLPLIIIIFLAIGTQSYVSEAERIPTVIYPTEKSDYAPKATDYDIESRVYKGELAFIDLETTGLSPENGDRIIEIAILITDSDYNILHKYETLINPDRKVSATRIHGITDVMVFDAPAIEDVNNDILAILNGKIIVAHNANFEKSFLNAELEGKQIYGVNFLDTLKYARAIVRAENHKLETVANYYKVPYLNSHTAMGDVIIMHQVAMKMLPKVFTGKDLKPYINTSSTSVGSIDFSRWKPRNS